MELFLLLIAAVVLVAVYYAMTALTSWWNAFRNRNSSLLRAIVSIAVAVAVVVFVVPESATLGPVLDVVIGAVVALVLLGVVVLTVVVWRRPRRQALAPPAVPQWKRPLVERSEPRRNSQYNASRPPPLVERSEPRRNTERSAPRSQQPPTKRGESRWKSVYNPAGREQFVYAMGAFDKRTDECRTIKIGMSAALELRLAQVQEEQVGWTETVKYLGWGPGGEPRESMMQRRLYEWRYEASEWFQASPEVLAEVGKLERLTDDGRRLTEETKRSA